VREGNRTGKIRVVDVPYTRQEGQALSKKEHAEHAKKMGRENQKLTDEDLEQIRSDITSGVATNGELARKYGVSPATISRAVFGRSERR
jgi:DNA-binding transcriptional regulator YiaG